jgi:hypothetical protein
MNLHCEGIIIGVEDLNEICVRWEVKAHSLIIEIRTFQYLASFYWLWLKKEVTNFGRRYAI